MEVMSTNVLIIGSGVAGGVVAEGLLKNGETSILMIEAGDAMLMKNHRTWLDVVMAKKYPYDRLSDQSNDYNSTGNQPWKIEGGRLIVRGGSTMHWGGWCPRMKPEDFELKSRVGNVGLDWPSTYSDLEPYYIKAEKYLQVAGDSNDQDPPNVELKRCGYRLLQIAIIVKKNNRS
jgi:choline dehydrogenase-like flavoprotein